MATFTPDLASLCEPDTTAWRIVGAALGKNIDENRGALKDYLTIEGNPPLAEIMSVADEEIAPAKEAYSQKRVRLMGALSSEEQQAYLGADIAADDYDPAWIHISYRDEEDEFYMVLEHIVPEDDSTAD